MFTTERQQTFIKMLGDVILEACPYIVLCTRDFVRVEFDFSRKIKHIINER